MTDEFFLAATLYNLSWHEIVGLAFNSIEYAFVDSETKARLKARLRRELSAFEARMSLDNWMSHLDQSRQHSEYAKRHLQLEEN